MITLPPESLDRWKRNTSGWKPGLTKTFRNASGKLWREYGSNLQNVPDKLRRIYYADEGKVLIQVDQAGAEALVLSYLAPPGVYRQLFQCGLNVHCHLGLHLFTDYWQNNTPHDARFFCTLSPNLLKEQSDYAKLAKIIKSSDGWESKKRFYYMSKKTGHAHNYDMKGPTFQLSTLKESGGEIVLTRKQADEFLDRRSAILPEIKVYHSIIREQVKASKCLRNLFGYPRYFYGAWCDKTWREAYAQIPQSTVGCISNIAYVEEQKFIDDADVDWDLLNNCHDSTMSQAPEDEAMLCAAVKKAAMEQDLIAPDGTKFKMKAEVSIGKNWGKYDEVHNPDGMKEIKMAA